MISLEDEYARRYNQVLIPLAESLASYLRDCVEGVARIDQVCTRAKSTDRFVNKARACYELLLTNLSKFEPETCTNEAFPTAAKAALLKPNLKIRKEPL